MVSLYCQSIRLQALDEEARIRVCDGYAKSGPAFRFLAFKIGVCVECVNMLDRLP